MERPKKSVALRSVRESKRPREGGRMKGKRALKNPGAGENQTYKREIRKRKMRRTLRDAGAFKRKGKNTTKRGKKKIE